MTSKAELLRLVMDWDAGWQPTRAWADTRPMYAISLLDDESARTKGRR